MVLRYCAQFGKSRVREFLLSNTSYARFTQATRKFKKKRALVKVNDKFWCIDVASVDKLAKDNNGVKYLPVRQDWFD